MPISYSDAIKKAVMSLRQMNKISGEIGEPRILESPNQRIGPIQDPAITMIWPERFVVTVDSEDGRVSGFFDLNLFRRRQERIMLSPGESIRKATALAAELDLLKPQAFLTDLRLVTSETNRAYWTASWQNLPPFMPLIKDEFMRIELEAEKGELLGFFMTFWSYPLPAIIIRIDQDRAIQISYEVLKSLIEFSPKSTEISLQFVHPNNYWRSEELSEVNTSDRTTLILAWIVKFSNENLWAEMWVDAETAEILGGDRSR